MENTISFFTCCYEADWEFLLVEGRLNKLIQRLNYSFSSRNLLINNVDDKEKVKEYALKAIHANVIDNFYFSEEYAEKTFSEFSLKRNTFRLDGFDGYWFSIAPLTAIFLCDSNYMLYSTADCMMREQYSFDWISESICKLEDNSLFITTPLWDYYNNKKEKFLEEDKNCFYDHGFSDQLFVAKTSKLKTVNFNEYNPRSEIFPIYGGNHFERRIFSYMNNRNLRRCIFKDVIYNHEILIREGYVRKIGSSFFMNKLKYTVAKIKKKLRAKNIMRTMLYR